MPQLLDDIEALTHPAVDGPAERLRAGEYAHLDQDGRVYLDYTGAGVAAERQYRAHLERLRGGCFGNPHSENPAARAAEEQVERTRAAVLAHLGATSQEYVVVFTANATGACRLVGEAYPFGPERAYVLTADNHNSVNGVREFARGRGARVRYVGSEGPELRVARTSVGTALAEAGPGGLFAYPAQSNFSGVRHPLDWVELAHGLGYDVLLDAAAFLPTARLDLGRVKPDFVTVSWYKLFGYPTGVGCLVARREALARLRRPWYSGGTVAASGAQGQWHALATDERAFEDGTVNYLAIPDVGVGLDWLNGLGLEQIGVRVEELTDLLLRGLSALRHSNGAPLVRLYGPRDTVARGGTVAFNFLDPRGVLVDERLVEREAAAVGICLRTGCFCNPGAAEDALAPGHAAGPKRVAECVLTLRLPIGGAVRVSLGLASTRRDVARFLGFAARAYLNRPAEDPAGLPPRGVC